MNPYKIMLVDDEEEVRTSIIRKIDWQDAGFEVIGDAENGKEALEKIEQNEPDVVLTDIRMPYMDGLEMAENIRQRSRKISMRRSSRSGMLPCFGKVISRVFRRSGNIF